MILSRIRQQWPGVAALVVGFVAGPALAETGFGKVEQKMRLLLPEATSIAISETPVEGLLQVEVNGDFIYSSSDGEYVLTGSMYETDTRANLTEQARSVHRRDLMIDLDTSQEIRFSPVEPDYELLVFTDIDCGYCQKLHAQITEYMDQGIAFRYMAFPRAGINSASYDKAVSVWCADDRQVALTRAKQGQEVEPLKCDNPVEQQYHLGHALGVSGTPALVMSDGTLIPGYMSADALRKRLDSVTLANASP